jgi:two-component system chemotaxis response regulator CheB
MLNIVLAEGTAASGHLARAVAACPGLQLVAQARDVAGALEATRRLSPELVLASPRLDGGGALELVRRIMAEQPIPVVLVGLPGDSLLAEAQALGAVAVLGLPLEPGAADLAAMYRTLQLMASVKVVRRWAPGRGRRTEDPPLRPLQVIGIGASTGGPQALRTVLGGVAHRLNAVPVLVVQHMSRSFLAGFAEWLSDVTGLPVQVVQDGMPAMSGTIHLAPDGFNLGLSRQRRIQLAPPAPEQHFAPSIDHMFESLAENFGAAALGVLLTGMGLDGAEGLLRLRRAGGTTIVQDEASSAVFGMPREAVERGAAERQMTPTDIARAITTLG